MPSNNTLIRRVFGGSNISHVVAIEYCTPRVLESLKKYSASTCCAHVDPANFVRKPTTIVTGMSYVTNSARLPVLIGKGGLIINNSLNHNSIINGARDCGATVRVFQHNTPSHLEKVLREHIAERQPRTHRP
ncbi:Long chain base biosynthesis protein 2a [Capsicum chinense]|nr:Long chain base biosynthesis protein 2a [Capsicum chinense]